MYISNLIKLFSEEMFSDYCLLLLMIPVANNLILWGPDFKKDPYGNYRLFVKLPRAVFGILLLFPSRYTKYKVQLFAFISQLSAYLSIVFCIILCSSSITFNDIGLNSNIFVNALKIINYILWVGAAIDMLVSSKIQLKKNNIK